MVDNLWGDQFSHNNGTEDFKTTKEMFKTEEDLKAHFKDYSCEEFSAVEHLFVKDNMNDSIHYVKNLIGCFNKSQ